MGKGKTLEGRVEVLERVAPVEVEDDENVVLHVVWDDDALTAEERADNVRARAWLKRHPGAVLAVEVSWGDVADG